MAEPDLIRMRNPQAVRQRDDLANLKRRVESLETEMVAMREATRLILSAVGRKELEERKHGG